MHLFRLMNTLKNLSLMVLPKEYLHHDNVIFKKRLYFNAGLKNIAKSERIRSACQTDCSAEQ